MVVDAVWCEPVSELVSLLLAKQGIFRLFGCVEPTSLPVTREKDCDFPANSLSEITGKLILRSGRLSVPNMEAAARVGKGTKKSPAQGTGLCRRGVRKIPEATGAGSCQSASAGAEPTSRQAQRQAGRSLGLGRKRHKFRDLENVFRSAHQAALCDYQ